MKVIFDEAPAEKRFPLSKLLSEIRKAADHLTSKPVSIRRFGGVGEGVWAYESQLDAGIDVTIPFTEIEWLAESPDDFLDELFGVVGTNCFGILDASFMFMQSADKKLEENIASQFDFVRDYPDIEIPPTFGSPPPTPHG